MRINLRPRILTGLEEKVLRMRYGVRAHPSTPTEPVTRDPRAARELAQMEQRLQAEVPALRWRRG